MMTRVGLICTICGFAWLGFGQHAQLDHRASVVVHRSIAIPTQLEGHPVVEPHISTDPSDSKRLLVAAMVVTDITKPYESCRLSSFISTDGGQTWRETVHDWWGYDPWTAMLPGGEAVMSWIGNPGQFSDQYPVRFFSSDDGGETWHDKVQSLPGNHDGTKVVVSKSGFYFTTVLFNERMGTDVVLYRRVGNEPFSELAVIEGKGRRLNFCEPAILSDGSVVVPASDFLERIWVRVLDPKDGTFSPAHHFSLRPGGARGHMRLIADTGESSPFRDRVYFVRALGSGQDYQGVWLNYSSDKGGTWTRDTRIDLFESAMASRSMLAVVAVNHRGALMVAWVDAQGEPTQSEHDLYCAVSLDGGLSFQRPVRVTRVRSDPKTKANGAVARRFSGGGHYMGMASRSDSGFQLVWSDSRNGQYALRTCQLTIKAKDS